MEITASDRSRPVTPPRKVRPPEEVPTPEMQAEQRRQTQKPEPIPRAYINPQGQQTGRTLNTTA